MKECWNRQVVNKYEVYNVTMEGNGRGEEYPYCKPEVSTKLVRDADIWNNSFVYYRLRGYEATSYTKETKKTQEKNERQRLQNDAVLSAEMDRLTTRTLGLNLPPFAMMTPQISSSTIN